MTSAPAAPPGPRRWLRRLSIVAVVLLAGAVWLWNGPAGVGGAALVAFEIERRPDGSWPPLEDGGSELTVSLSLGVRTSRTNHNSSLFRMSPEGARLPSRSVLVTTQSADALSDAVARRVVAALREDACVERLACAPYGSECRPGGLAPDVVVTIGAGDYEEHCVVGLGRQRAAIRATVGDQLARSGGIRAEGRSPRVVGFHLQIDVETAIDHTGIATPNARLAAAADELANAIVERMRSGLADMRAEYDEHPRLPEVFFPEFRTVVAAALPLAGIAQLERVAAWHGPLLHNETWWRGVVPGTGPAALARIGEQLAAAGYEHVEADTDVEIAHVDGTRELRVFADAPPRKVGAAVLVEPAPPPPAATPVWVRYRERADDALVERAIEATLTEDAPVALLTLFAPSWSDAQTQRGLALIGARQLHRAEDLLLRADLCARQGDQDGAAADVRHALWQARATIGGGDLEKRVEKAAERHGVGLADARATPAELTAAGFLPLPAGGEVDAEVTGERPLRCFLAPVGGAADEDVGLLAVGLQRAADGSWEGAFRLVEGGYRREGSAIRGGVVSHSTTTGVTVHLEFVDEPDDGVARVRLTCGN